MEQSRGHPEQRGLTSTINTYKCENQPRNGSNDSTLFEDPAFRRVNGNPLKFRRIAELFPMAAPEIIVTGGRPIILHGSDFTTVTETSPRALSNRIQNFYDCCRACRSPFAGRTAGNKSVQPPMREPLA
jgi:hypothetical protein